MRIMIALVIKHQSINLAPQPGQFLVHSRHNVHFLFYFIAKPDESQRHTCNVRNLYPINPARSRRAIGLRQAAQP